MNTYPLMRIQGRRALKIQGMLNRGLSQVHHKNKEPKRQCNVAFNLITAKDPQKEIDISDLVKELTDSNERYGAYILMIDRITNACKNNKNNHWSIYFYAKTMCKYVRRLINKEEGSIKIDDYIKRKLPLIKAALSLY